jgi:hypothetical protein
MIEIEMIQIPVPLLIGVLGVLVGYCFGMMENR